MQFLCPAFRVERKAVQPMNFGFNSNVHAGDAVYHVQTEDRGADHPFIDTVVYNGGRVVHKRSTSYRDLLAHAGDPKAFADLLHSRLSQQHKDVIAQMESGSLDLNSNAPAERLTPSSAIESGYPAQSGLTLQLANPASWVASGGVTLRINILCGKAVAGGADVEAFFESAAGRSRPCLGKANADGFAEMHFPMPASTVEGTTLVIRATLEDDRGELRFRLKPTKSGPVPTTPAA
jgi:hypothetical protein